MSVWRCMFFLCTGFAASISAQGASASSRIPIIASSVVVYEERMYYDDLSLDFEEDGRCYTFQLIRLRVWERATGWSRQTQLTFGELNCVNPSAGEPPSTLVFPYTAMYVGTKEVNFDQGGWHIGFVVDTQPVFKRLPGPGSRDEWRQRKGHLILTIPGGKTFTNVVAQLTSGSHVEWRSSGPRRLTTHIP